MRLFTSQGQKGLRLSVEIMNPIVAKESVTIKVPIDHDELLEQDGRDAVYVRLYLTQQEAEQVGRLVGMLSRDAVPSDSDIICEEHPTKQWPHLKLGTLVDCAGPGMPWQVGRDLLQEARAEVRSLDASMECLRTERDEARDRVHRSELSLTAAQQERDDLRQQLAEERSLGSAVSAVGVAMEDAKAGEWVRVRFGDAPEPEEPKPPEPREDYFTNAQMVSLTYFESTGERFDAVVASFYVPAATSHETSVAVAKKLSETGKLPGLAKGLTWRYGTILVSTGQGSTLLSPTASLPA